MTAYILFEFSGSTAIVIIGSYEPAARSHSHCAVVPRND